MGLRAPGVLPIAGIGLVATLAACSPRPARTDAAIAPHPAPDTEAAWTYEVVASPDAAELAIEATFPPGTEGELALDEEGSGYVRDVEFQGTSGWSTVEGVASGWRLPAGDSPRRIRYRFLLARAGVEQDDPRIARARRGAVESPPSIWLVRPRKAPPGTRFRFHVSSAPGEAFATGVFPAADAADTYEGRAADMIGLPFAAFGAIRVQPVGGDEAGGDGVVAAILPGRLDSEEDVLAWIRDAARAVRGFYGRMPTPRLVVFVRPIRGADVGFGTTMGRSGAAIAIDVGARASRKDLRDDWVLVHEMTHTALPEIGRPQHWFEEGLATYVEPLARVRAGLLSRERLWKDWIEGMPKGLPEAGDQGLDRTHTWGRTYWGGALFCLVADLEIRERTGGRKSLRDGLIAILAAGGNISVAWPVDRVIEVADAATGVPVLRETYDRMKESPVDVDLASTWKRLGVSIEHRSIRFDHAAPLASARDAMTRSGSDG